MRQFFALKGHKLIQMNDFQLKENLKILIKNYS